MTPGFCPDGYKVPSLDEWRTLITAMGGTLVGGGELKEIGTDHWLTPNTGAVDTYSFAALGGGDKNRWTGVYENLKETGFFWTSTPASGSNAYAVYMTYDSASIVELSIIKDYHLSVRLMKSVYSPPPYVPVIYGLLYNWYAATDARGICADGWHVGLKSDYDILASYLGGVYTFPTWTVISPKIKETGTTYWGSPNADSTNESCFNARGSGVRIGNDGTFSAITNRFAVWIGDGISYRLQQDDILMYTTPYMQTYGLSIRLVKDTTSLSHGQTGTYQNNDGKTCRTICIGTQEWLADNLAETKFRTGEDIPIITDNAAWAALTTAGMCAYNNDWSNV
jgi:uncharacterized protein (TIGR02145 family)